MTTENFCFYLQNSLIQSSQTGGQWYNDISPFSIPWLNICVVIKSNLDVWKPWLSQPKWSASCCSIDVLAPIFLENIRQTINAKDQQWLNLAQREWQRIKGWRHWHLLCRGLRRACRSSRRVWPAGGRTSTTRTTLQTPSRCGWTRRGRTQAWDDNQKHF